MNKDIIEKRIHNFLGYGNLNSSFWFFGMEEGFDGNLKQLEKRFINTNHKHTFDSYEDMKDVKDHIKWFSTNPPLQPTMSKLIRLYLSYKNNVAPEPNEIRNYQEKVFGRMNGDTLSLNLMPLPCKSVEKKDWFYDKFGIEYLSSRSKYLKEIMPIRVNLYKNIIKQYKPKVIVFYSTSYLKQWKEIIDTDLTKVNEGFYYAKKNNTNYFVIRHPAYRGLSNEYWNNLGFEIKKSTG